MTLYEINAGIRQVITSAIDPETGEIDDSYIEALESLQIARDEKIENIACWIKNLAADANAIRDEELALAKRRKTLLNRAESLQNYLRGNLNGEKFSSPRAAISFRKTTKVVVDETRLAEVPQQYLRYKDPEVDKAAVKEALKAGQTVPGCALEDSLSMIIK